MGHATAERAAAKCHPKSCSMLGSLNYRDAGVRKFHRIPKIVPAFHFCSQKRSWTLFLVGYYKVKCTIQKERSANRIFFWDSHQVVAHSAFSTEKLAAITTTGLVTKWAFQLTREVQKNCQHVIVRVKVQKNKNKKKTWMWRSPWVSYPQCTVRDINQRFLEW